MECAVVSCTHNDNATRPGCRQDSGWVVMVWRRDHASDINGVLGIGLQDAGNHVGLIYRPSSSDASVFLHLAWHLKLLSQSLSDARTRFGTLWLADSPLDEFSTLHVAAMAHAIRERNIAGVIYGFNKLGVRFNEEGSAVPPPLGRGLTCATFVLTIFECSGLTLLLENEWPIREDDPKFHRWVVSKMREYPEFVAHADAMEHDVGKVCRFRPAEVAAGAISNILPVSFATATAMAEQVLAQVRQ